MDLRGGIENLKMVVMVFMVENVNCSQSLRLSFHPDVDEATERRALMEQEWNDFEYNKRLGDSVMLAMMIMYKVILQVYMTSKVRGPEFEEWVPDELLEHRDELPKVPVVFGTACNLEGAEIPHYIGTRPMTTSKNEVYVPSGWRCEKPKECQWADPKYCEKMAKKVDLEEPTLTNRVTRSATKVPSKQHRGRKDFPEHDEIEQSDLVIPKGQLNKSAESD